jgi:hypothetical protein
MCARAFLITLGTVLTEGLCHSLALDRVRELLLVREAAAQFVTVT